MRRTKAEAMQTRENVLQSAAQIIIRRGIGAFTIEAVARQAGISKGGVLYHFPSREALVNGLIDEVVADFNTRLQVELAAEPAGQPGRWLRAYIRIVFHADYGNMELYPGLAAAVAADHRTLEHIRRSFEESQRAAINDGIDPAQATMIRLAVDGLVFTRALNLHTLDTETSRQVYEKLLHLTTAPAASA